LFQIVASFLTFILQGSAAVRLRCGGIFNNYFITLIYCQLSPMVQEFKNRSTFGAVMSKSNVFCFFLTHGVGLF